MTTIPSRGGSIKDLIHKEAAAGRLGAHEPADGQLLQIDVDLIDESPFQGRSYIDQDGLEELAAAINDHGLLQAVTARRVTGDRWQLIAGHRRTAAVKLLRDRAATPEDRKRWATIRLQEKVGVSDLQMILLGAVENLQREDPSIVDSAATLARYQDEGKLSLAQVAEHTGLELQRVKRLMRVNAAPMVIREGISKGVLVPMLDEAGVPLATPSGRAKQEHRHLDMMAALEFCRLYEHWLRETPKKAVEKTEAAIKRALLDNWGFRRISTYIGGILAGRSEAKAEEAAGVAAAAPAASVPLFKALKDGAVTVYAARVAAASPEDRAALVAELERLLAVVRAA